MGETVSVLVLIRIVIDTGLGALLSGDRSRSAGQRIAAFGKAMTSRMESAPARMDTVRSQPRARPA